MITGMRAERIKRNWTLEYIGNCLGVTRTAIGDIERLRRKPSYDMLVGLEELFGLTRRELFELVEDVPYASPKRGRKFDGNTTV